MTTQDPNHPENSQPNPNPNPMDPPLASSSEPTRLYPTEPSKTYSSDPSKYAYPPKPSEEEKEHVQAADAQDAAYVHGSDVGPKPYENYQQKEETQKKHQEDSSRRSRTSKKIDELYPYASTNRIQTITYILLILGLILMFFNNLLGGLLIGMVAGYHFAPEIIYYVRHLDRIFAGQDQLRYITLTALLLGLFIAAPGIFAGAAIMAAFKQVLSARNDDNYRDPFV